MYNVDHEGFCIVWPTSVLTSVPWLVYAFMGTVHDTGFLPRLVEQRGIRILDEHDSPVLGLVLVLAGCTHRGSAREHD